jgi:hypothetical protein
LKADSQPKNPELEKIIENYLKKYAFITYGDEREAKDLSRDVALEWGRAETKRVLEEIEKALVGLPSYCEERILRVQKALEILRESVQEVKLVAACDNCAERIRFVSNAPKGIPCEICGCCEATFLYNPITSSESAEK